MLKLWRKFANNQDGATAIEYGLIAALIALAIVAGLTSISGAVSNSFNKASNALQ